MFYRNSEHRLPSIVPDLRGKTVSFTTEYDVSCALFIYVLHAAEVVFFSRCAAEASTR